MNAMHIKWTKPCNIEQTEDFELLTTILSALKWREKNGKIGLITDSGGEKYYKSQGLDMLWDNGISCLLDEMPAEINPANFWAAGKIFALKHSDIPATVIDTDFIIWEKLSFKSIEDAAVIHFEEIYPDIYPGQEYFRMKHEYKLSDLNWNIKPCNTAFYIIKNKKFRDSYVSESINFMKNAEDTKDNLKYMVFAEQRLFNMCADKIGIKVDAFSELSSLYGNDKRFTHIWGMKQQMRENPSLREKFCIQCINRIISDYPYMKSIMKNIEVLSEYFE